MTSLDDKIYQLFSELLLNAKECNALSFNEKLLETGHGPFLSNTGHFSDQELYLGSRANLLGFAHPLIYKARLISSLSPNYYCSKGAQEALLSRISRLIQKVTGRNFFASLNLDNADAIFDAGRYSTFLSSSTIVAIESGSKVLVSNLLPFPFSISARPSEETSIFITEPQAEEGRHLLKLLELGDFYGTNGHISRLSKELSKEFNEVSHVRKVEGLLIYLEKDRNQKESYSFLEHDESIIYLPLFFDSSFLAQLKQLILE